MAESFSRLAPHRGLSPILGHAVGTTEMRGGLSFSSLLSGLNKLGNFVSSAAHKVGNSNAFQQAKTGFLQSGILENAGQLAGQTLSSLVDIGRVKLERDLQKLREKASGQQGVQLTDEQLAQLLAAQRTPEITTETQVAQPVPLPAAPSAPPLQNPTPIAPPAVSVPTPLPAVDAVPLGPYVPPSVDDHLLRRHNRKRKRLRGRGWSDALDGMVGHGAHFYKRRYCY